MDARGVADDDLMWRMKKQDEVVKILIHHVKATRAREDFAQIVFLDCRSAYFPLQVPADSAERERIASEAAS